MEKEIVSEMEYEGIGIRALSIILDSIILSIFFFPLGYTYTGSFPFAVYGMNALPIVNGTLLITLVYFILLEGLIGQTIGKLITGIKVVKTNGDPCDLESSLIRNLLRIVDVIFAYIVGAILIARSDKNQRFGDRIANTVVVNA